jgi:hypothetical protein
MRIWESAAADRPSSDLEAGRPALCRSVSRHLRGDPLCLFHAPKLGSRATGALKGLPD